MKEKRKVSSNLGRTQGRDADKLYAEIKKRTGATKKCPFYGGKKHTNFNLKSHNKLNPSFPNPNIPIEEFDFQLLKNGEWGLQSYCKVCYKAYRDSRIKKSRDTWIKEDGDKLTDNEIRSWYRKNVSKTMMCSVCEKDLDPKQFVISRSMEKGLHNVCVDCSAGNSASAREQMWLADGDWNSWSEIAQGLHRKSKVKCSGWSRSVEGGYCIVEDDGKKMHADHIIPLRAGGIHDAKNFQALCSVCNIKKSDQIDQATTSSEIKKLVGRKYKSIINSRDSIPTIERKLKSALVDNIEDLVKSGLYLEAIAAKKKEVNGQWVVMRAYRKGIEWINGQTKK